MFSQNGCVLEVRIVGNVKFDDNDADGYKAKSD